MPSRQRTMSGGMKTPTTETKRVRTNSQSSTKTPVRTRKISLSGKETPASPRLRKISQSGKELPASPKGDKMATDSPNRPKTERRRSTSVGESKRKKQVEVTPKQHYSYRMHRVKFFDYEPQPINCIACDETNHRLALSR